MKEQKIGSEQVLIFVDTLLAQYDDIFLPLGKELDANTRYLLMLQAQQNPSSEEIQLAKDSLNATRAELRRQLRQAMPILKQQSAEFKLLLPQSLSEPRE